MKLVGSITMATKDGDKALASMQDLGANPSNQVVQHSLHQFLSGMANSLSAQDGTFRAMSVTVE